MKIFIVLSALVAVGIAKPSGLVAPLVYAKLVPGAPIGPDGRVVDTPEVSYAKAEHAAAHLNEKLNHASEAFKSADYIAYTAPVVATSYAASTPVVAAPYAASAPLVATSYAASTPVVATPYAASTPLVATSYAAPTPVVASVPSAVTLTKYTAGGAPIGLDGRVVDTPEVAYAKAEHAAAHINHNIEQSNEALKSASYIAYSAAAPIVATSYAAAAPAVTLTKYTAGGAPIGLDGRVIDTPEVAYAKAEHAAAKINQNIEQSQEIFKNSLQHSSPLIISSYAAPAYASGYYYY